jgi:hypothetical protein
MNSFTKFIELCARTRLVVLNLHGFNGFRNEERKKGALFHGQNGRRVSEYELGSYRAEVGLLPGFIWGGGWLPDEEELEC